MSRILNGVTTLAVLAASGASAQSLPMADGFFIHGYTDLSYGIFPSGNDQTQLRAVLDLGVRPASGGFGFSLGIDGFSHHVTGFDTSEFALYPAVTYATQFGEFSAGAPRSVIDRGYLPQFVFAGSNIADLEFNSVTGSVLATTYLFSDDMTYGLRYDGSFGATSLGASYHHIDTGGSADIFSGAVRHEFDAISSFYRFAVFAGLENVDSGASNRTNYMVGVEGGTEQLNAGLVYRREEVLADGDIITAFAEYSRDKFSVTGSVLYFDFGAGTETTFYGASAEYRFYEHAYVDAGVLDSDNPGSEPIYEFSVGWRF